MTEDKAVARKDLESDGQRMKFNVSVIFPDFPVDSYQQERQKSSEIVAPFEGRITDVMVWSHQGKDAHCVWFTSSQPQLHVHLHEALVAGAVWSYSIALAE